MENVDNKPKATSGAFRRWLGTLGPGFITAAVVIGPGTITVASKLGAEVGTGLVWGLLIAGGFMMFYTALAARVGVLNESSLLTLVAHHYGRWLAVLVGISAFLVCAAFQSSNYLACSTALTTLTGVGEGVWIGVVGAVGLIFVFGARQLYRFLEKIMLALVLVMLVAFVGNLAVAGPNPVEVAAGLIPRGWPLPLTGLVVAMVATTFSVIAALYQSTLAQQKGWHREDLQTATREALTAMGVLLGISLMVMLTSATKLRDVSIDNAGDLASQLVPLLGPQAVWMFGLGFLAAGFSSTVMNAMVGGGLLADSLGFSADINRWPSRLMTSLAMVVGLASGVYNLYQGTPIDGILLMQKTTILAVPLCALVMILVFNNPKIMGRHRLSPLQNIWAILALLVVVAMSLFRLKEIFS